MQSRKTVNFVGTFFLIAFLAAAPASIVDAKTRIENLEDGEDRYMND